MNSLINVGEKLKFFREIHKSGERPPYIDICKLKSKRNDIRSQLLLYHMTGRHDSVSLYLSNEIFQWLDVM
jgi:hypothetical protein